MLGVSLRHREAACDALVADTAAPPEGCHGGLQEVTRWMGLR